jgi:hypothetical protein
LSWSTHYSGGELRADYYIYTPAFAGLLIPITYSSLQMALMVWGVCNLAFLIGAVWCTVPAIGRFSRIRQELVFATAYGLPSRLLSVWGLVFTVAGESSLGQHR